jgi:serine/threonine-protein kinase
MATKYCPTCQKTFTSTERLCPNDRSVLSLNDPYHLVGRTLLDKYRIDALVGLGGMGAVYYAYHSGIDRHVAFKILQPNVALGDDHMVEMFEREAKLAGRLTHENIVDVKDAGHTDEGIAYIVMEWLEGRTLDDELLSQRQLGFIRAAGIARQIAAALGEAHGKHVIHRDLKPGNIMLIDSPDGRDHLKVLDFGIGKTLEETKASSLVSGVMGTPHYASPEQLTIGGRIDGRSDIYSLGVILYRMLGGRLPFNSPSIGEVIQMQLTSEPAPLSVLRPETPPEIVRLVSGMLEKDPARRPQSAAEVGSLLDQALPHLKVDDHMSTGETTILRGNSPASERTTEDLYGAPPLGGTYSTNVLPANRSKYSALHAAIIGATLMAVGYGVYTYVSDSAAGNGARGRSLDAVTVQPSPSTSGAESPQPSATVAEVRAPSPNTATDVKSGTRTNPGESSKNDPSQSNRARQDNRQLADKRVERARALYKQGRYQAALSECNEALKLYPQHRNALELKREINDAIKILNPR